MKPKEYLKSIGAISEITRGRLSLENIEKCKAAAASGIDIEGYTVSRSTAAAGKPAKVEVKKAVVSAAKEIADIGDPRYDEREWEAYRLEDGKRIAVGMRTSCNTCHNALSYHFCDKPLVWADYKTEATVLFRQKS